MVSPSSYKPYSLSYYLCHYFDHQYLMVYLTPFFEVFCDPSCVQWPLTGEINNHNSIPKKKPANYRYQAWKHPKIMGSWREVGYVKIVVIFFRFQSFSFNSIVDEMCNSIDKALYQYIINQVTNTYLQERGKGLCRLWTLQNQNTNKFLPQSTFQWLICDTTGKHPLPDVLYFLLWQLLPWSSRHVIVHQLRITFQEKVDRSDHI